MLKLENIKKSYIVGDQKQQVLKGISTSFRKQEFVSILGPSGCGKTTLLNIIGGLDKYDSGNLKISGVSTENYKSSDWDSYRNHKIGFVFQSYNLIMHQTILSNVELSLTLSGISKKERNKKAKDVLKKVGLGDYINKLPNQLSGGQMQRVAIARALVNDPEIILADEPTGALDSKTSVQIMDLLKEVSLTKLVIMVTHNPELAKEYSTRIVELKDGLVVNDSNPYDDEFENVKKIKLSKKAMSIKASLGLSLKNLLNKKGRTLLTAIAGSVGIVGIALVLSLATGVKVYVNNMQVNSANEYPISIERYKFSLFSAFNINADSEKKAEGENIISHDDIFSKFKGDNSIKKNNVVEFKKSIEKNNGINKYVTDIKYNYDIDLQLYSNTSNGYQKVETIDVLNDKSVNSTIASSLFTEMSDNNEVLNQKYEVLAGKIPVGMNEIALIVNSNGNVPDSILYALNIKDKKELVTLVEKMNNDEEVVVKSSTISYKDLLNIKYKMIFKIDNYKYENGNIIDYSNDINHLNKLIDDGIELKVVGILKTNLEDGNLLGYRKSLTNYIISHIEDNNIANMQLNSPGIDIFTKTPFDGIITTYQGNLDKLGIVDKSNPKVIEMYPKDKESKEKIIDIIKQYNTEQEKNNRNDLIVEYTDSMEEVVSTLTNTINIISYVLIAFVAISLIVSSIMIAIITYISVLERTKEIGILRAIGASKKDVTRVFMAETIIEGFISGTLGVGFTLILNVIINLITEYILKIGKFANLQFVNALFLIALSVLLTVIAGLIPSNMAGKKRPVEALRSE